MLEVKSCCDLLEFVFCVVYCEFVKGKIKERGYCKGGRKRKLVSQGKFLGEVKELRCESRMSLYVLGGEVGVEYVRQLQCEQEYFSYQIKLNMKFGFYYSIILIVCSSK